MMTELFSVAIDGPSGAGKSTLSKKVAAEFGFVYVDTGAIYRTVGFACSREGVDLLNEEKIASILSEIDIDIRYDSTGLQHMFLNEEDVSEKIRTPEISMCASKVSSLPTVRAFLLDMQRGFARKYNVIMDGRDIGTVVLPNASLKIYLTATSEARAQRRFLELKEKGIETTFESVLNDIVQRDYQDTHRAIAPLKKAKDAIELDTSGLDFEESFKVICSIISNHMDIYKP